MFGWPLLAPLSSCLCQSQCLADLSLLLYLAVYASHNVWLILGFSFIQWYMSVTMFGRPLLAPLSSCLCQSQCLADLCMLLYPAVSASHSVWLTSACSFIQLSLSVTVFGWSLLAHLSSCLCQSQCLADPCLLLYPAVSVSHNVWLTSVCYFIQLSLSVTVFGWPLFSSSSDICVNQCLSQCSMLFHGRVKKNYAYLVSEWLSPACCLQWVLYAALMKWYQTSTNTHPFLVATHSHKLSPTHILIYLHYTKDSGEHRHTTMTTSTCQQTSQTSCTFWEHTQNI